MFDPRNGPEILCWLPLNQAFAATSKFATSKYSYSLVQHGAVWYHHGRCANATGLWPSSRCTGIVPARRTVVTEVCTWFAYQESVLAGVYSLVG